MQKLHKVIRGVCRMFFAVSLIGIFMMMVLIVADVLARVALNKPIMGSYELVQTLMVILVFFAFGYTQLADGHVRVTLLIERFPKTVQRYLNGVLLIIVATAMFLVSWATFVKGMNTITTTSLLYIPLKPIYYLAALGALIYAMAALINAIEFFVTGKMQTEEESVVMD